MLGLNDYSSSSDEDEQLQSQSQARVKETRNGSLEAASSDPAKPQDHVPSPSTAQGPAQGPIYLRPNDHAEDSSEHSATQSTTQQLVHSLTLPPIPSVQIPPSPPGSPNPNTAAKISKFLSLKRNNVHFTDRLAASPAMHNPSLLSNLLDFAGIDEERGQYANTLPERTAPLLPKNGFPKGAYAEELGKAQTEGLRRREEERKKAGRGVEFVAARREESYASGERVGGSSAAERVMAGLNSRDEDAQSRGSDGSGKSKGDPDPALRRSRYDVGDRRDHRRRSRSPRR